MSDIDWQRQCFVTEAQAQAFAAGLTYGDEPKFCVDAVEPCRYPGMPDGSWDVVFGYHDAGACGCG